MNKSNHTKPDIMFICNSMDRSEVAIAKGIIERGYRLRILIAPDCNRLDKIRKSGLLLEYFSTKSRLDLKAVKTLRNILKTDTPDIIYAPTNKTLSVSLLATKKMPTKIIGYRGTIGHVKRYNPASWLTYLHPRLSHIICVSQAVRQHLINDVKIPADKTTAIYKGHDVVWYQQPDPVDLQTLGIARNSVVTGFAGNMRPVKGVDVLIHALDYLPESTAVHLLLIGDVRDKQVKALINSPKYRNRITATGYRGDAPSLINACDIFVMPSVEREGLPRAVIEAMAMQLPVIVSDVGGMPEQIINNECGFVVPPRDAKALAAAVRNLADSPELRKKFGDAAGERVKNHFDINTTINAMCSLFDKEYHNPS